MMTSLKLWDGQIYPRAQLEDFYKICQKNEIAESHFFVPNYSADVTNVTLPQYILTPQYVKAAEFLSRKPLSYSYQEVIDKFYINSKRLGHHISGPTIMHMFSYDDLEDNGTVPVQAFVDRIQDFLSKKKFKGNVGLLTNTINELDLRFLATKYMSRDGSGAVNYHGFLEDYISVENIGLGAGIN